MIKSKKNTIKIKYFSCFYCIYYNTKLQKIREGIIDKLIKKFCDSPYINQENYAETVYKLVEIFYEYKNETMDLISDDELIELMKKFFDGIAGGDLEYKKEEKI